MIKINTLKRSPNQILRMLASSFQGKSRLPLYLQAVADGIKSAKVAPEDVINLLAEPNSIWVSHVIVTGQRDNHDMVIIDRNAFYDHQWDEDKYTATLPDGRPIELVPIFKINRQDFIDKCDLHYEIKQR